MKEKAKKKGKLNFRSVDSLQPVVNVVNDVAFALNDTTRTIQESPLNEVLLGALGSSIGGAISFTALYGLGTVGLSAVGITSGLSAAGGAVSVLIGGALSPMVAGIFILALPVAGLAAGGVGVAAHLKGKQLKQEKDRLYREALRKHDALIWSLKEETNANKERLDYLQSLNILLQQAIKDLKNDLEPGA